MPRATNELFNKETIEESSAEVRERICKARDLQWQRQGCINTQLQGKKLEQHCELEEQAEKLLMHATQKLKLSARGLHRIIKVARTIADLNESEVIKTPHLSEAINLRKR